LSFVAMVGVRLLGVGSRRGVFVLVGVLEHTSNENNG
jgi:hypothetical protein